MSYNGKRKVTFDFDGGILTWDFFDNNQLDQLKADPVGTGVGLLNREANSIANGHTPQSYDGIAMHPGSVRDLFIEIESLEGPPGYNRPVYLSAPGTQMRAHVESGSTSGGAYGELPPEELARTRKMFVSVFAPETIIVPPMPRPFDSDSKPAAFARAAREESDAATLRHERRLVQLRDYVPPPEPPDDYDGPIVIGAVS